MVDAFDPGFGTLATMGAGLRRRVALLLMAASGFAGLGYQIVWTQQCAVWLGHESAAVLAVLAAFFGGLALGALALGPAIERSERPLRWYAACEFAIGAWGLVLLAAMAPASAALMQWTGVQPSAGWQWTVAFAGSFFLLLPATAAMGATLPAMERVTARLRSDGRSIAAHYAANTAGAVLGVLATALWLIPEFGLARSAGLSIALNLACACGALATLHGIDIATPSATLDASAARPLLLRLAVTGLLGIGYEVMVVRVLSQVAEDTVYTFAMLLAVYLVGSALGAAAWQRWLRRRLEADAVFCALAVACLLGTGSLWAAQPLRAAVVAAWGQHMAAAVAAEALLGLLAFGLPTLAMGALFSHLSDRAAAAGIAFGRAIGVNLLAAAAAPVLFGVLLAPWLGPKAVLLLIAAAYLALLTSSFWRSPIAWTPAITAAALAVWAPPLAFVDVPPGGRVLSYQEGSAAAVSVVEDANGVARLRIDNRQQEGDSSTLVADARQALLPLLLHPAPQRALFLGLGTGITATAATLDAALQVDAVELLPEVIEASHGFVQRAFGDGPPHARLHLMAADARRYVRTAPTRYDVIVSDNFHPARSGSGALYTVEHFQAVRTRLAPGGLFCQWLPLHQLDLPTLRSIARSFQTAYPQGVAMLAGNSLLTPVIGLVGRADDGRVDRRIDTRFDMTSLRRRLASVQMPAGPAAFGIEDEFALLGSVVADAAALTRFASGAPANTDDRPVVAYRAPRITYEPDSLPSQRLLALLQELSFEPAAVMIAEVNPDDARRLAAYATARRRFLAAGQGVRPSGDVRAMLAQVQAPLLNVLRASPDFRPAYDPLLRMATALGRVDPPAAAALLDELMRLQPARAEAALAAMQLLNK